MSEKSGRAVYRFKENRPTAYFAIVLALQVAGMVVIAELVGTQPLWRQVVALIGIIAWSLSLVELNYRLGEDPRHA